MPLIDYTNPGVIKFIKESIEKEKRNRVRWANLNKSKLMKAVTLTREFKNLYETDVIAHNMQGGLLALTRDNVAASYNRRKKPIRDGTHIPGIDNMRHGHSIAEVGLGDIKDDPRLARTDTDLKPDPRMRPIDPIHKEMLYNLKISAKPNREKYLEERVKILPEDRYYFSECTNWDYGWRLKDSKKRMRTSYGRCWVLARALQTRAGPQPDPPHYVTQNLAGPAKCS